MPQQAATGGANGGRQGGEEGGGGMAVRFRYLRMLNFLLTCYTGHRQDHSTESPRLLPHEFRRTEIHSKASTASRIELRIDQSHVRSG